MKFAIALAALLGVGTAPALAGDFYTNVEYNGSNTGSNFTGSTTDIHICILTKFLTIHLFELFGVL